MRERESERCVALLSLSSLSHAQTNERETRERDERREITRREEERELGLSSVECTVFSLSALSL
jgi:hypothetical protein